MLTLEQIPDCIATLEATDGWPDLSCIKHYLICTFRLQVIGTTNKQDAGGQLSSCYNAIFFFENCMPNYVKILNAGVKGMTLTFDLQTLFICSTHHLILAIVCAGKVQNPFSHGQFVALKPLYATLTFDLYTWFMQRYIQSYQK